MSSPANRSWSGRMILEKHRGCIEDAVWQSGFAIGDGTPCKRTACASHWRVQENVNGSREANSGYATLSTSPRRPSAAAKRCSPRTAIRARAADTAASATEGIVRPAAASDLPDFLWHARPVIVFADSPDDPRFIQQIELLEEDLGQLAERDVIVLTDADPDAKLPLRQRLRPRGFMLVLVGKDGVVELRKPLPWTVREITRSIDKMPIRREELRN